MRIDYKFLLNKKNLRVEINYDFDKAILYALSVGMGGNLANKNEMPFVYEGGGLKVLPPFATIAFEKDVSLFDEKVLSQIFKISDSCILCRHYYAARA